MRRPFKPDLPLGAAIIAAPLFWWLVSLVYQPMRMPQADDLLTQRFIVVALVYPLLEEIVFRGLLQGWLRQRHWGSRSLLGITSANLLVSLLFTVLHVVRRASPWALAVFIPSLVFGFFRDRYGTLTVPIGLHIFYNAGLVLLFAT